MKECEICEGTMWYVNENRTQSLQREIKTNMKTAIPIYSTVITFIILCVGLFFLIMFFFDRNLEKKRIQLKIMKEKQRIESSIPFQLHFYTYPLRSFFF